MIKVFILSVVLLLTSCSAAVRIAKETPSLLESFFKSVSDLFRSNNEHSIDIADSARIADLPMFKSAFDTSINLCHRNEWRAAIKSHIEDIERTSSVQEFAVQKLEQRIKQEFTKELVRLGPLKSEVSIIEGKMTLSVDTPCGTEKYLKQINKELDSQFSRLIVPSESLDKYHSRLIIGSWNERVKTTTATKTFVFTGTTIYKENNTYIHESQFTVTRFDSENVVYAANVRLTGKWKIEENYLHTSVDTQNVFNIQNPDNIMVRSQRIEDYIFSRQRREIIDLTNKSLFSFLASDTQPNRLTTFRTFRAEPKKNLRRKRLINASEEQALKLYGPY